jgi:hypothetical protein
MLKFSGLSYLTENYDVYICPNLPGQFPVPGYWGLEPVALQPMPPISGSMERKTNPLI